MKETVYEIIKDACGIDEINDDMSLENDLGLDSLSRILLLVALEEKCNITFEASDLEPEDLKTVGGFVRLAEKYEVNDNG